MAQQLQENAIATKLTPKRESAADYATLESETRLIGNLVKMIAWDAEGTLAALVRNTWKGVNGNERGIVSAFLSTTGSLKVSTDQLNITLEQQAEPWRTRLLEHVCQIVTERQARYPGTDLTMVFEVAKHTTTKK